MQTIVDASRDENALSISLSVVRKRFYLDLHINLVTAFIFACVVGIFEDIIFKYITLAILNAYSS